MKIEEGILTVVRELECMDRSAIVLKRHADSSYVVGKNYILEDDEVQWCWGSYDIKSERQALLIANNWVFPKEV